MKALITQHTSSPLVAFQGELGAYSEVAARAFFGSDVRVSPRPTFAALFNAVQTGACTHGMVPIENSLAGSIHENYDHLLNHQVRIQGELMLRIQHTLIAHPGVAVADIRWIHSHPQALAQCSEFIRSLPDVTAVVDYDTAGSAKQLKAGGHRDRAAIASARAALHYGLEVIAEGIANDDRNYTRFLVIGEEDPPLPGPARTTIVFSIGHVPGALHRSLQTFADRNINLLKIESRPLVGRPWEYFFYLDFEGHPGISHCAEALESLKSISEFVRVLGAYPIGRTVENAVVKRDHDSPGDAI